MSHRPNVGHKHPANPKNGHFYKPALSVLTMAILATLASSAFAATPAAKAGTENPVNRPRPASLGPTEVPPIGGCNSGLWWDLIDNFWRCGAAPPTIQVITPNFGVLSLNAATTAAVTVRNPHATETITAQISTVAPFTRQGAACTGVVTLPPGASCVFNVVPLTTLVGPYSAPVQATVITGNVRSATANSPYMVAAAVPSIVAQSDIRVSPPGMWNDNWNLVSNDTYNAGPAGPSNTVATLNFVSVSNYTFTNGVVGIPLQNHLDGDMVDISYNLCDMGGANCSTASAQLRIVAGSPPLPPPAPPAPPAPPPAPVPPPVAGCPPTPSTTSSITCNAAWGRSDLAGMMTYNNQYTCSAATGFAWVVAGYYYPAIGDTCVAAPPPPATCPPAPATTTTLTCNAAYGRSDLTGSLTYTDAYICDGTTSYAHLRQGVVYPAITETCALTSAPPGPPPPPPPSGPPADPAPILSVSRVPNNGAPGSLFDLVWSATNATAVNYACAGAFNGASAVPVNGAQYGQAYAGALLGSTNCTWTATGPGGVVSTVDPFRVACPAATTWDGAACLPSVAPIDRCDNIVGDQLTVPAGYIQQGTNCMPANSRPLSCTIALTVHQGGGVYDPSANDALARFVPEFPPMGSVVEVAVSTGAASAIGHIFFGIQGTDLWRVSGPIPAGPRAANYRFACEPCKVAYGVNWELREDLGPMLCRDTMMPYSVQALP